VKNNYFPVAAWERGAGFVSVYGERVAVLLFDLFCFVLSFVSSFVANLFLAILTEAKGF
jgi:hypothetical protein